MNSSLYLLEMRLQGQMAENTPTCEATAPKANSLNWIGQ